MPSIGQSLVSLFRSVANGRPVPQWFEPIFTALIVAFLHAYRLLLSRISGRRCMFSQSCSGYALGQLESKGWNSGRTAIIQRLDQCNGQYVMSFDGHCCRMSTSDGQEFEEAEIAPWLVDHYRVRHAHLHVPS